LNGAVSEPSGGDAAPGPDVPATGTMLGRAVRLACPLCGHRPFFRRWFAMDERCSRCGLRFERVVGQWFGSLALNTIVSFGALLVVVLGSFLASWPDAPPVAALVAGLAVALLLPLAFFPWSRTLWLAFDLRIRPLEPGEAPGRSTHTGGGTGHGPLKDH
jgi:uncharacterized protein (DUF983 family)